MQASIISTAEGFKALEERWNRLVARSTTSSVFQTFAWQWTWWRYFGGDQRLCIVIAEKDGDLVGVLPLFVEHRTDLLPAIGLRRLRLVGFGGDTTPDDLGPITAGDDPELEMEALMVGLQSLKGEWDIALFEDLHEDCALIPLIQAEMGDRVDVENGINITFAKLPDSWDGFLATCSQRRRWKLRRGRKKLAEHTPYRFILVKTQEELDIYYPALVRLHRDRWKESPGQGGFSTTNYVEFHRAVTKEMLKQDALRLMFLLDGEDTPIAANYCYCWRGAYYGFQMGFALDYQHLRVGEVLMCHAIEQAIDEGMEIFDMLRGDHDYKQWLTNGARQRMNVLVHQPTMRTMTYKALRAGFRQAKKLTAGAAAVPEAKPEAATDPGEKDAAAAKPAA